MLRGSCLACCVLILAAGGCGGSSGDSEREARKPAVLHVSTHAAPTLEQQLPVHVAGLQIQTKSFTGDAWFQIAPRILPDIDFAHWLNALGVSTEALTAAWGETTSIRVIVYRIVGGRPARSLAAFVDSIDDRRATRTRTVARKRVTALTTPAGTMYLYTRDEYVFQMPAGTDAAALRELVAQLS